MPQKDTVLATIAQRLGRTPEEVVHDAEKRRLVQVLFEDRLSLLRQAPGIRQDWTDLPSLTDLRRE